VSENNKKLLVLVKELLLTFEKEGTENLRKKHANYAVCWGETIPFDELKGKEVPFVYVQRSFIEELVNLDISKGQNMHLLGQKVCHKIEDFRSIFEELSLKEIQNYWQITLSLQDALWGKQKIFDKALSLRDQRDAFSTIGYLACRDALKQWYNVSLNIEYVKPDFSLPGIEEEIPSIRSSLFFLLKKIEEEVPNIVKKETVFLTFAWREKVICEQQFTQPYIVFEEDFWKKGVIVSEEYPEHFFNKCRPLLNILRDGPLIKNLSTEDQDVFWRLFSLVYFLENTKREQPIFLCSVFYLEQLKEKDAFHERGILRMREFFRKMTTREIEDFYPEDFRNQVFMLLLKANEIKK
jgi:predicted DNA-binding protein YlxM (UPF0122 family)